MPKRDDINKVMIIGSGPIVIGQACEFDYSGTQACKALRSLGYEIVLVNSNPATIMTDPGMADVTYIEPLTLSSMEDHRQGTARRAAAEPGRAVGPEPVVRTCAHRGPGEVRRAGHRRAGRRHRARRGPRGLQGDDGPPGHRDAAAARSPTASRRPRRSPSDIGLPGASSARPTRWAAPAAGSSTTWRSSRTVAARASPPAWSARSWSRNRCWAGRSSNSRSCATPRTR